MFLDNVFQKLFAHLNGYYKKHCNYLMNICIKMKNGIK